VWATEKLDYLGGIEQRLPIGSGEIESGHRDVVQKRMKRAGAWWKPENGEIMLQLLTLRTNNRCQDYWSSLQPEKLEEAALKNIFPPLMVAPW
jgi:hypothetical protein